jgi:endonuclease G, mitochondrial
MQPAAFADQIRRTQERYEERAGERAATVARIEAGGPFAADTPERVAKRLSRLRIEPAVAEAVLSGDLPVMSRDEVEKVAATPARAERDFLLLERVIGDSNELIESRFLEGGYRASRSVARIEVRGPSGRVAGYGTGTLVSPRLLLTNNHVLGSAAEAANSRAEFGYEHALDGALRRPVAFALDPRTFFLTDPDLDYSLVAVAERGLDGVALADFGWNRLIEAEGKVLLGEAVNIIQHPGGEPKQLAMRENQLVDLLEDFVHYTADTAQGSSGAAVFSDDWEIVALHHSGVPKRDEAGQLLKRDGQPWDPSMDETQLAWIANEGARVSRIIRHLKAQSLSGQHDRLRSDLFELAPPTAVAETAASLPLAVSSEWPTVSADGAAVWTLPLQVSVRLGATPSAAAMTSASDAPATPSMSPAGPAAVDEGELRTALAELERARRRPYYEAEADRHAREQYYAGIDATASPDELYRALGQLVRSSHERQPVYKPSRELYPWIELHPDRKLRSIYSGKTFEAEEFIRADLEMEARRAERLQELSREATSTAELAAELDALEAAFPFNCEHVVPQSWFQKREPMRGDLHHLFACEWGCNSFRGNTPYFEFTDFEEALRDECGKREQRKFEPSAGKGAAARAVLYFLLRYPGAVADEEFEHERLPILLAWHKAEPPGEYEQHRNQAIHERQGNRNPLIDHPDWAGRIGFAAGLG